MRYLAILLLPFVLIGAINEAALKKIIDRYHETESDALRIEIDGRPVLELGKEKPIEIMSITKSVVNLAVGILVDQGKIESIDTPLSSYYPEFIEGEKKNITIRHLLNHTSGIKNFTSIDEGAFDPNFIQSALNAPITHKPGTRFLYNNRAVNLLSGIVEKAAGKPLDLFVEEYLFAPLEIDKYYWNKDFSGNPWGMAGLEISARSLSKIGQLVLNEGVYNGIRVVSKEWLEESLSAGQQLNNSCGLLWWLDRDQKGYWPKELLAVYRENGISEDVIEALEKLEGRPVPLSLQSLVSVFGSIELHRKYKFEVLTRGLEESVVLPGTIVGYRADGYLGQYLLIIPKDNIVAVRQFKHGKKPDDEVDCFEDFVTLVHQLVVK